MPIDMSQVKVHRCHRWTLTVRYLISQGQAAHILASAEPEIEVTNESMIDITGPRCLDCLLTQDAVSNPRWCDAPEPRD